MLNSRQTINQLAEHYKDSNYSNEWRLYVCHTCKLSWSYPIKFCSQCGLDLDRIPSVGTINLQELAKLIPDYIKR